MRCEALVEEKHGDFGEIDAEKVEELNEPGYLFDILYSDEPLRESGIKARVTMYATS